jgi:hypothetical protein
MSPDSRPRSTQRAGCRVEIRTRPYRVAGRQAKTESIACKPWEDVQVDVADLLASSFAVREKKVDPLASEARAAETYGRLLGDQEQSGTVVGYEVSEVCRVRSWDDKHVALRDGLDVHQRDRPRVLMDDGHLALSRGKLAEQTVARL